MTDPVTDPVTKPVTDQLTETTPCAGLLPRTHGAISVSEAPPAQMTLIAPYRGQAGAVSKALKKVHGFAFPAPGEAVRAKSASLLWFGRDQALLIGPAPGAGLTRHAALTDLSDAYARVCLVGPGASDVLARLTPLDLRATAFPVGAIARTELAHMAGAILRDGDDGFTLMVYRSMAATLVHEVVEAMITVTGRAALGAG